MATKQHHHFLIVTYPAQGHITPTRHLARRLASACPGGTRVITICAPLSAFRKMFPGAVTVTTGHEECRDGDESVVYVAYSDGYDGEFDVAVDSYGIGRHTGRARGRSRGTAGGCNVSIRLSSALLAAGGVDLLLPVSSPRARAEGPKQPREEVKEEADMWGLLVSLREEEQEKEEKGNRVIFLCRARMSGAQTEKI